MGEDDVHTSEFFATLIVPSSYHDHVLYIEHAAKKTKESTR